MQIDEDLVAAPAAPLVLAVLSDGASYGYAILKRVRELSGGEREWSDGMLYPLLHRLHRLGYLQPEWRTPPDGRRRRYYAIAEGGRVAASEQTRRRMAAVRSRWDGRRRDGGLPIALGAS